MGAPELPGQVNCASAGRLQVGHIDLASSASQVLHQGAARWWCRVNACMPMHSRCHVSHDLGRTAALCCIRLAPTPASPKALLFLPHQTLRPSSSRVDVRLLAALLLNRLLHPLAAGINVIQLCNVRAVVAEALQQGALQCLAQLAGHAFHWVVPQEQPDEEDLGPKSHGQHAFSLVQHLSRGVIKQVALLSDADN